MTKHASWLIPFTLPLAIAVNIRLLAAISGLEWTQDTAVGVFVFSLLVGMMGGMILAAMISFEGR